MVQNRLYSKIVIGKTYMNKEGRFLWNRKEKILLVDIFEQQVREDGPEQIIFKDCYRQDLYECLATWYLAIYIHTYIHFIYIVSKTIFTVVTALFSCFCDSSYLYVCCPSVCIYFYLQIIHLVFYRLKLKKKSNWKFISYLI